VNVASPLSVITKHIPHSFSLPELIIRIAQASSHDGHEGREEGMDGMEFWIPAKQ